MADAASAPTELHSFEEFWPHYVRQHQDPINRALHFVGLSLAMRLAWKGVRERRLLPLVLSPLVGYGLSFVGHIVFEQNKPASFSYPRWSLRGDFRMWNRILRRKMGEELERATAVAGVSP